MYIKAKKALGQNFLTSALVANLLVNAADIRPGNNVLEIGPGKGIITSRLLSAGAQVTAIELDKDLLPILEGKFGVNVADKSLEIVNDDVLNIDPQTIDRLQPRYQVVANIPYNITGAILRHFLSHQHKPDSMTLLVQKEVAERIVDDNSILSLSVRAYGTPKYIKTVRRSAFRPEPKVDSAIIHIYSISDQRFTASDHEQRFFDLLHAGFRHKRKRLLKNIQTSDEIPKNVNYVQRFTDLELDTNIRAEELSIEQWLELAQP